MRWAASTNKGSILMPRSELLQLMAAQIFAGMATQGIQHSPLGMPIETWAETAVRAAKAIEDQVAKQLGPRGAGVPRP